MRTAMCEAKNLTGRVPSVGREAGNGTATDPMRWDALVRGDPQATGAFVYAVQTTGVYCRPGCSSRLPKRENVRFFDHWLDAERAGFRPCKRCRPDRAGDPDLHVDAIVRACQMIESSVALAEKAPSLNELASAAGLSPFYFHRLFKQTVGVTPKQYAVQIRLNQVRGDLQRSLPVTDALYNAGFASNSRFYENITATLGMKPSEARSGANRIRIRFAIHSSYLGWVLIATTDRGVCAIDFGDSPEILKGQLRARFPKAEFQENDPTVDSAVAQVLAFLRRPQHGLGLPLDIQGTAFQRRVWMALSEIPAGSTITYTDVAARLGNPNAARAVAQACASNPIAVAIPCHRVVRRDGDLGGYRWGVQRKRALLELEGVDLQQQHRVAEGEEAVL